MTKQNTFSEKSNKKLVAWMKANGIQYTLEVGNIWRMEFSAGGQSVILEQKKPTDSIKVNGNIATSQTGAIRLIEELLLNIFHPNSLEKRAEKAALSFLKTKGYLILEESWICAAGGPVIVAEDGDCLVFIKVNVRILSSKGFECEVINSKGRERLEQIAAMYIMEKEGVGYPVRFDIVTIMTNGGDKAFVRHEFHA